MRRLAPPHGTYNRYVPGGFVVAGVAGGAQAGSAQGGSDSEEEAAMEAWRAPMPLSVVMGGRGLHSFTLELNLSNSRTHL